MKKSLMIAIFLILILSLSFISAFSFSEFWKKMTGNLVHQNEFELSKERYSNLKSYERIENDESIKFILTNRNWISCVEEDGRIIAEYKIWFWTKMVIYNDFYFGDNKFRHYFCDEKLPSYMDSISDKFCYGEECEEIEVIEEIPSILELELNEKHSPILRLGDVQFDYSEIVNSDEEQFNECNTHQPYLKDMYFTKERLKIDEEVELVFKFKNQCKSKLVYHFNLFTNPEFFNGDLKSSKEYNEGYVTFEPKEEKEIIFPFKLVGIFPKLFEEINVFPSSTTFIGKNIVLKGYPFFLLSENDKVGLLIKDHTKKEVARLLFAMRVEDYNTNEIKNMNEYSSGDLTLFIANWNTQELKEGTYYVDIVGFIDGKEMRWNNVLEIKLMKPSTSNCIKLIDNGDSENNLDLVFIGDNYLDEELDLFANDVDRYIKGFLEDSVIGKYKNRINFYLVNKKFNLECKYDAKNKECVPAVMRPFIDASETGMCCNLGKSEEAASSCPFDIALLIANSDVHAGTAQWKNFGYSGFNRQWEFIKGDVLTQDRKGIASWTRAEDKNTAIHEFGHVAGFLPDYYISDPSCEEHPCKMCSSSFFPFSDELKCYDKQKMVMYMNQWCDGKVSFTKRAPYPNPFSPPQTAKVEYKIEYPEGADACYVLLTIRNTEGKLVDMEVSEDVVESGIHTIAWDGKDLNNEDAASGVYTFEISAGNKKAFKGTLLK